jgi:hypothetical protein
MTTSHSRAALAATACALLLAACGGGGGGGEPVAAPSTSATGTGDQVPGTGVPTAATTSVGSVIAFLQSLIGATSETGEPVALGHATLATSETDDPVARP